MLKYEVEVSFFQFLSFQSLLPGALIVLQQQDVCAPEIDQNRLLCVDNNIDISWLLRDFSGKHADKYRNSALFLWGPIEPKTIRLGRLRA